MRLRVSPDQVDRKKALLPRLTSLKKHLYCSFLLLSNSQEDFPEIAG